MLALLLTTIEFVGNGLQGIVQGVILAIWWLVWIPVTFCHQKLTCWREGHMPNYMNMQRCLRCGKEF